MVNRCLNQFWGIHLAQNPTMLVTLRTRARKIVKSDIINKERLIQARSRSWYFKIGADLALELNFRGIFLDLALYIFASQHFSVDKKCHKILFFRVLLVTTMKNH